MRLGVDDTQALRLTLASMIKNGHTVDEIVQCCTVLLGELTVAYALHGDQFLNEEIKRIQAQGGKAS